MLTEISTILTSLNTARQIGTAILDLKQHDAIRDRVFELKDKIGDAQDGLYRVGQERSELADKVRELEIKIAEFDRWETESVRYRLVALAPNVMAMRLVEAIRTEEPDHLLCANCFTERKKRFLTQTAGGNGYYAFRCNSCNFDQNYTKRNEIAQSDCYDTEWSTL